MVRAPFTRSSGLLPACALALSLVLVYPTAALASLSEPWASSELDGAQAIASGHGRYVAVGSTGSPPQAAAWSSADGLTWEKATVPQLPDGSVMTDVVATKDGFVAFGVESEVEGRIGGRAHAWSSRDGLEWQDSEVEAPAKPGYRVATESLTDGRAGQLALGSLVGPEPAGPRLRQRLWRSADGQEWEKITLPKADGRTWSGVVAVPQGYLLLGQSLTGEPYNWRSPDGTTWKRLPDTPQLYDVAVSDNGVLLGMGYEEVWRSAGSLGKWRRVMTRPKGSRTEGANAFSAVAWDGSEFVVVGRDYSSCELGGDCERNPLFVSIRGSTWSEAAGPDGLPGADRSVQVSDVTSLDDSTVVLGANVGATTLWRISATSE